MFYGEDAAVVTWKAVGFGLSARHTPTSWGSFSACPTRSLTASGTYFFDTIRSGRKFSTTSLDRCLQRPHALRNTIATPLSCTRRTGGPLDGNDPGPAMVPVLEHVDAVRGACGSGGGSGGGPGNGFVGGTVGGGGGAGAGSGPGGASVSTASDGLAGMGGGGDSGSGPGGGTNSGGGVGDTPGRFRGEGGGNPAAENLMSFEPAFGGGGGGGGLSPTSMGPGGPHGAGGGFHGTAIETQQYELQMRMVDILMESLQYARALR